MMINSITPPPELMREWVAEIWHEGTPVQVSLSDEHIATCAAQWGADQELEACCALLEVSDDNARDFLQSVRRPKPPSLKEQALLLLDEFSDPEGLYLDVKSHNTIRRALEQLDD